MVPIAAGTGCCAVFPVGNTRPVVVLIIAVPVPVGVKVILPSTNAVDIVVLLMVKLPRAPTILAPSIQIRFPVPSVLSIKSSAPPVMETLALDPKSNMPVSAEIAAPDKTMLAMLAEPMMVAEPVMSSVVPSTVPVATTLFPETLPVAETLAASTVPVTETLLPEMLPAAATDPVVLILPASMLPAVAILPEMLMLAMLAVPTKVSVVPSNCKLESVTANLVVLA